MPYIFLLNKLLRSFLILFCTWKADFTMFSLLVATTYVNLFHNLFILLGKTITTLSPRTIWFGIIIECFGSKLFHFLKRKEKKCYFLSSPYRDALLVEEKYPLAKHQQHHQQQHHNKDPTIH